MKIYYEFDSITDNCTNPCPFKDLGYKGETGEDCQVGSITCQECKFCYGRKKSNIDFLYLNNKLHMRPMHYINCMWGEGRFIYKLIYTIRQCFHRLIMLFN